MRDAQLTAFFAAHRDRLLRTVERSVITTPAVLEDACQHAWLQLVRRHDVTLDRHGFWWLHRVAVHQVFAITSREACEHPMDPLDLGAPTVECTGGRDVAETAEHHELIALVDRLPVRQRRLILLHVSGFTYDEITRMTGDSHRTVERQLLRARRELRRAQAAR